MYFGTFGEVVNVDLCQSRGFAFCTFAESDSAEKALLQQFHPIEGVLVEVRPAMKRRPTAAPRPPRPPGAPFRFDVGPRGRLAPGEFLIVHPFPRPVPMRVKKEDQPTSGFPANPYVVKKEKL